MKMKKRFLSILLGLVMVLGLMIGMSAMAYADEPVYTPLSVTGFDADVVADDGAWAQDGFAVNGKYVDATVNTHTEDDGWGCVFVSSVFSQEGSFPGGQTITTASGKGYTLQPTTADNALQVAKDFTPRKITLTSPGSYESIGILTTGGNGEASLTAVVEYSDGTKSDSISVNVPDWYGGDSSRRVYGPLSRTRTENPGNVDDTGAYLYETTIQVDPEKAVSNITFSFNGAGDEVANIFALSGVAAELKHTVSFNLNGHGDTAPAIQKVSDGGKASKPTDPQDNDWTISGWYKEKECTNEWKFDSDTVSANTTLFAKWIEKPAHTHDFTYSASDATITATCNGAGDCDITEGLTLTISAPTGELVSDGTKTFPATLSEGYNTTAFPGPYSISYTKDGSAYDGEPKEAGSYTASVTVGDGAATASVSYVVTAPTHAVTARVVPEGAGTVALDAPQVAEGATVGIEATPAEGYEFAGWTVDGAGAKIDDAASPRAKLTMGTADATVTATFRKKPEPEPEPEPAPAEVPPVSVTAHVQRKGTLAAVSGGAIAGTTGKSLRMESIKLTVDGASATGGIEYRGHVQRKGWEKSWAKDGAMAGTEGKSRRMEAVQVRLWGDMASKYDVYYRVHSQRYGWMGWAKNGESAGTQGMSRRAEAIQVVLVKKDAPAPDATYKGVTQAYAKAFAKK